MIRIEERKYYKTVQVPLRETYVVGQLPERGAVQSTLEDPWIQLGEFATRAEAEAFAATITPATEEANRASHLKDIRKFRRGKATCQAAAPLQ